MTSGTTAIVYTIYMYQIYTHMILPVIVVHDFGHHRHLIHIVILCMYVLIESFIYLFIQPVTTHEQRCWCRCVFTFRVNLHKDVVWWLSAPPPSCCHPLMYISIEWFSYVLVHISILCVCVSSLSLSLSLSFFRHTGLNPSPWTAIVYTFVIPCMYLFVHLGIPNVCVIFSLALAFLWCKCLFAGCRCVRVRRGEGGHL